MPAACRFWPMLIPMLPATDRPMPTGTPRAGSLQTAAAAPVEVAFAIGARAARNGIERCARPSQRTKVGVGCDRGIEELSATT